MNPKIPVCAVALLILSQGLPADAATTGVPDQNKPLAAKPKSVVPQIQHSPAIKSPSAKLQTTMSAPPGFKMTCPNADEITLLFSYVGGWVLNPSQLKPESFTRAYGQIEASDKSKVSLACLYQVTGDFVAAVSYNGNQECYVNSSGEGNIRYSGPSGYTMNVAGTTALGLLPVKKTGEHIIENQKLECQLHGEGQAQFFKKYQATANLSACSANGREVTCRY